MALIDGVLTENGRYIITQGRSGEMVVTRTHRPITSRRTPKNPRFGYKIVPCTCGDWLHLTRLEGCPPVVRIVATDTKNRKDTLFDDITFAKVHRSDLEYIILSPHNGTATFEYTSNLVDNPDGGLKLCPCIDNQLLNGLGVYYTMTDSADSVGDLDFDPYDDFYFEPVEVPYLEGEFVANGRTGGLCPVDQFFNLNGHSFTISVLYQYQSLTSNYGPVLIKIEEGQAYYTVQIGLNFDDDGFFLAFFFGVSGAAGFDAVATGREFTIIPDFRYHLICTYDVLTNKMSMRINGGDRYQVDMFPATKTTESQLQIGDGFLSPRNFNTHQKTGSLGIWKDRILTEAEENYLHNNGNVFPFYCFRDDDPDE